MMTNLAATSQAALNIILADPDIEPGIKAAIRRLVNTDDPAHVPVEEDGTPVSLANAQREIARLNGRKNDMNTSKPKQDTNHKAPQVHEGTTKTSRTRGGLRGFLRDFGGSR